LKIMTSSGTAGVQILETVFFAMWGFSTNHSTQLPSSGVLKATPLVMVLTICTSGFVDDVMFGLDCFSGIIHFIRRKRDSVAD